MKDMNVDRIDDIRRASTESFLLSYGLRKKLELADEDESEVPTIPEEDKVAREECKKHLRPFDGEIGEGQVRLLSQTERLTYALVARRWNETDWLVIPFSSYSSPATDTELKLSVEGGLGLRVLQLWNARSIADVLLQQSWLVDTLPAEDLEDVQSAWLYTVGLGELSGSQLARTGLPIMRRDDPRVAYQDESLANFAKLDSEDLELEQKVLCAQQEKLLENIERLKAKGLSPFKPNPVFEQGYDYAYAAASIPAPVSADCRLDGFDGCVHVRFTPTSRHLQMRVFDEEGNRSTALDGWQVLLGSDPKSAGCIEGCDFSFDFAGSFDGRILLADLDGKVYKVENP